MSGRWKMIGRYADGEEIIISGQSEEDCICVLDELTEDHGDLVWYSGYCDEDYSCGEYVGRENFVYA